MKRLRAAAPWIGYAMGGVAAFALSSWAAVSYVGIALLVATFKAPRRLAWVFLLSPLLSVPVASFLWGGVTYATGTAKLRTDGLSAGNQRPDRETRCEWVSSGCEIDGSEMLWQHPHNEAVRWFTRLFGPMPGVYADYYPTQEEVHAVALETWAWIPSDRFMDRWKALTSAEFSLPRWARDSCSVGPPKLKVVKVGHSGILVIRQTDAWLFERETGRLFAWYGFDPVRIP